MIDQLTHRARADPDAAAFFLDNFVPESFNKNVLYGAIAAGYQHQAMELPETSKERSLTNALAEYFERKCEYLKRS